MTRYEKIQPELRQTPKTWLVTGVAGFIGSNLLETLLKLDQRVVGLDNFATGHDRNLDEVKTLVTPAQWANFHFVRGDIRQLVDCQSAMNWRPISSQVELSSRANDRDIFSDSPECPIPVDYVLHQAALGSVPRSLEDPISTNDANISGFLNMLVAARDANVKSFTYAASSSTYGDHPGLPKVEEIIGKPLSPYAVTKYVNELYAEIFSSCYGFKTIGLRYFNVFGPRQDPNGSYAAVIPKWINSMINGDEIYINGDGETSRDFCYIENVCQANILASTSINQTSISQIFNVAAGDRTSLNELHKILLDKIKSRNVHLKKLRPIYKKFRVGDVKHSLANIDKIKNILGYEPSVRVSQGLSRTVQWHLNK